MWLPSVALTDAGHMSEFLWEFGSFVTWTLWGKHHRLCTHMQSNIGSTLLRIWYNDYLAAHSCYHYWDAIMLSLKGALFAWLAWCEKKSNAWTSHQIDHHKRICRSSSTGYFEAEKHPCDWRLGFMLTNVRTVAIMNIVMKHRGQSATCTLRKLEGKSLIDSLFIMQLLSI